MTATVHYPPVRIEDADLSLSDLGRKELLSGLLDAKCEIGEPPEIAALHDDHPAALAWYAATRLAAEEIVPEVERLLAEAIRKQLPWTWEPDR